MNTAAIDMRVVLFIVMAVHKKSKCYHFLIRLTENE